MKASAALILDKRSETAEKTHPVKLRVIFQKRKKLYPVKYSSIQDYEKKREELPERLRFTPGEAITLTEKDYNAVFGRGSREPYSTLGIFFSEYLKLVRGIIETINDFEFDRFEEKAFSKKGDSSDVLSMLESRAKELRGEGRIGTAITFECALNSLKDFNKSEKLSFTRITVKYLKRYEQWFMEPETREKKIKEGGKTKTIEVTRQRSPTTLGIYLRNLRAVYRKALKAGIVSQENYPFGQDDYQIPGGANVKKALTQAEVGQIAAAKVEAGSWQQYCRDLWLFSYLCNGANVKDIAQLQYKNISGDVISFIRAKTARERRSSPKVIQVVITRQLGRIIDRWGNKPGTPESYIFDILKPGMTPAQQHRAIQQTVQNINKNMKKLGKLIGLDVNLNTYVARHSFATVLKRSGASTEYISESLGHSNVSITENYLGSFEIDQKRSWAEMLLPKNDEDGEN